MDKLNAILLSLILTMAPAYGLQQQQTITARLRKTAAGGRNFTHVQQVSNSCSGTDNCTVTITGVGSGHMLIVDPIAGSGTSNAQTSVACTSDSGTVTYTVPSGAFLSWLSTSDHGNQAMAYLISSTSGSHSIKCTWTPGGAGVNFNALDVDEWSYTGTIAFDNTAGAQSHAYPSSTCPATAVLPTITPTNNGSLVFASFLTDMGAAGAAGSPWTQIGTNGDEYYIANSSGTVTPNFAATFGAGDSCGVIVEAFH